MGFFGSNYPSTLHVYHHYPSKPCETCGYVSNSGYYDEHGMMNHIKHTIDETTALMERAKPRNNNETTTQGDKPAN